MPFQVDPNAVYPIASVIAIVLFALLGLKIFPTNKDFSDFEARIAEKYVLKDDVDKKLDAMKQDFKDAFQDIKADINRVYDKLDAFLRRNP